MKSINKQIFYGEKIFEWTKTFSSCDSVPELACSFDSILKLSCEYISSTKIYLKLLRGYEQEATRTFSISEQSAVIQPSGNLQICFETGQPIVDNEFLLVPITVNSITFGVLELKGTLVNNSHPDYEFILSLTSLAGPFLYSKILLEELDHTKRLIQIKENEYTSLLSGITGMVFIHIDGTILEVNKALSLFVGYSQGELKDSTLKNIIDIKYQNLIQKKIEERKHGVLSDEYEIEIRTKDGTPKTVVLKPTFVKYKNTTATLINMVDITDQKNLQDLVLSEQEQFQSLMNNIPDTIYFKDLKSRFTRINAAQVKMLGVNSVADVLGKTDYDFFPHADEAFNDERKIMNTGIPIRDKVEYIKNGEGKNVWVSTTKFPLKDKYNKIIGTAGISRDITERIRNEAKIKISETQFRAIWENSFDGMRLINEKGIIVLVNRAFIKISGKNEKELIGQHYSVCYLEQYRSRIINRIESELTNGIKATPIEDEIEFTEGVKRWFEISNIQIIFKPDHPMLLSIFHDISERKRIEEKLLYRTELEMFVTMISTSFIHYSPDEIYEGLNRALCGIGNFLEADRTYLYLFSDDNSYMRLSNEWCREGNDSSIDSEKIVLLNSIPFLKSKLEQQELVRIPNGYQMDELTAPEKSFFAKRKIRSAIFVPLVFTKKLRGLLGFDYTNRDMTLQEEDSALLETIADIFISSIERKISDEMIKNEKEELSVTLRSVADGVITTDAGNIIKIINESGEKIIGLKGAEIYGTLIEELFKRLNMNVLNESSERKPLKKRMSSSNMSHLNDYFEIETKPSERKIIFVYSADLNDPNGKLRGFVYVIRDVTEELKMEKQLLLSQKMESIGLLAAGIAHEINTPMQYINDNTFFLKESFDSLKNFINDISVIPDSENSKTQIDTFINELGKKYDIDYLISEIPLAINQTQDGIEKVNNIISAMKDFAHPGSKTKTPADINRGIEVTATISRNVWKYIADMELNLCKELTPVNCIADEINQAVLNIIINAAHAIEEKFGRNSSRKGIIRVSTSKFETYIEIKISDSGNGIAKDNLPKIFDPFFTTKSVGKGTGQGLSIVHDIIVNKHNGKILVESEPGIGTEFTIQLPI